MNYNYIIIIIILNTIILINCNNSSLLELCNNQEHIYGKWIHVNKIKKSFYCCSWDENSYLDLKEQCNQEEIIDKYFFNGNVITSTQGGAHSCKCDIIRGKRLIPSERENYEWITNNCKMIDFSGLLFCNVLKNDRILLVGDSTMLQTAVTLMSMITTYNGKCSNQIYFGLSNFIVRDSPGKLIDYIDRLKPEIIIITIAAHIHLYEDYQNYHKAIIDTISIIREKEYYKNNKPIIFWKGSNPGHNKCENYVNNNILYNTSDEYFDSFGPFHSFAWNIHRVYDDHILNNAAINNYTFIDMWPLYLRPDAHTYGKSGIDCLHLCIPGPLDIFSNIILQLLMHKKNFY